MPRSWQEDFFERLVTVSQQTGDPRLASAKLHPRKKTASFTHSEVSWIECVFDTNRFSGNPNSQVLVITHDKDFWYVVGRDTMEKGGRGIVATIHGVIYGKTIELERELGLPEGQRIAVELRPLDEPPAWLEQFVVDPTVRLGKFVIKGTRLLVDDLVQLVEEGRSDEDLRQTHPELSAADVDAVRNYARVPEGMRRSFGGWAEDAEELDEYLDWTRQQRKLRRPEIPE